MSKKKIPSPIQKVADLRSDPCNANLGTERGVAALARSLEAYGAGRAVLIDRHGVVIAWEQDRRASPPPESPSACRQDRRPASDRGPAGGPRPPS